jgi:hypothetical protein
MLYTKKVTVCSETHKEHINVICDHSAELMNVKTGGTNSMLWALKGSIT